MSTVEIEAPARRSAAGHDRWLGVELRHLAALVAISREGSFRGAAARLGYVQSAISQQIKYLESSVGTQLIHRQGGRAPVRLTEAGTLMVDHAEGILARLSAARDDLASRIDDGSECIRLGVGPDLATDLLATLLCSFSARCPAAEVVPTEAATDDALLDLVQDGAADFALVDLPPRDGPFVTLPVLRDPCVLLVQRGGRSASIDRPVTRESLRNLPLVVAPGVDTACLGVPGRQMSTDTAIAFATAGIAPVLARLSAVTSTAAGLDVIGVDDVVPPRVLGLCWHRDRDLGATLQEFLATARELPPFASR